MEVDIIVTIGIAAVILFMIAQLSRIVRTNSMHKTLRKAIEHGQTLDPNIVEKLDRVAPPGVADQRIGLVLVAIAIALLLAAVIEPGDDAWKELMTIALFPLLVGAALLARAMAEQAPERRVSGQVTAAEEADFVRQAAGGDLAAFAALVRAHEAPLRRYLARLAGEDGDDLAQETLLGAWRAIGQWRGEGSFGGWLRAIATRRFLDSRRRRRVATRPIEPGDDPVHDDASEQRLAIDAALASLPAREKAAALLLFAEGYSHGEAAAILELPLGTLKSIAARARAALIPLLQGAA